MNENAKKIQDVINDDLFPTVANVSDVKQVLEFMKEAAQPLGEDQIRGLILLEHLGSNERLHGNKNPYKCIIDAIKGTYKISVADTQVYLDTIEELIPKPPKPIVIADGKPQKVRRGDA